MNTKETLPSFERLMVACWKGMRFDGPFQIEKVTNKFVQLGYYCKCAAESIDIEDLEGAMESLKLAHNSREFKQLTKIDINDNWLLKLIIDIEPGKFLFFNARAKDSEELVWRAATKEFFTLGFASQRIRRDRNFIYRVIEASKGSVIISPLVPIFVFGRHDTEIILHFHRAHPSLPMSVENPHSILKIPEQFRGNKSALINSLKVIDADTYCDWYGVEKNNCRNLLSDPDVIAVIIDRGFLCEPDPNYSKFPGYKKLISLCDNYNWMKERILVGPNAWNFASDRLQKKRELLLLAFEAQKWFDAGKGMVSQVQHLDMDLIPESFWNDDKVIEKGLEAIGLHIIPMQKRTKEMVKLHLKYHSHLLGIFQPGDGGYELLREAVLDNILHMMCGGCDTEKFASDPELQYFIDKNSRVIYWMLPDNFIGMYLRVLFHAEGPGQNMDRYSMVELLRLYPHDFARSPFIWAHNEDIAIEAVRADGNVFGFLDHQLQNKKSVQEAIGPLNGQRRLASDLVNQFLDEK